MNDVVKSIETRPVTIRKVHLWRRVIDARSASLAETLQPLGDAGVRLQTFMRYRHFRDEKRAVVEVCLHESENEDRCTSALRAAGFTITNSPVLLIEGDEAPGIEYAIAKVVAEQNLNVVFCVTQVINGKWGALLGFVSEEDAEKAALSLLLLKIEIPTQEEPKT